jgi:hypothetical protein
MEESAWAGAVELVWPTNSSWRGLRRQTREHTAGSTYRRSARTSNPGCAESRWEYWHDADADSRRCSPEERECQRIDRSAGNATAKRASGLPKRSYRRQATGAMVCSCKLVSSLNSFAHPLIGHDNCYAYACACACARGRLILYRN